jgi:Lamin Tail Domain
MPSGPKSRLRTTVRASLLGVALAFATRCHAQLQFTEVMHSPGGDPNRWEWVEVRNTSASAIDLDGWIFDDDDDVPVSASAVSNIKSANGNTIVPAGGVAVLYAGSDLEFMPARFTNAWGPGINLIPVNSFTSLTSTDAIGLWPNRAAYDADDLGPGMNPRRSFAHAAASLDYAADFPGVERGHSIVWNGSGSPTSATNWVESQAGVLQAVSSTQTIIESTAINSTADRANPGVVPGGVAPAGLRITEIMYDPDSPESDWEWVEVLNNTPASIDFSQQPHVLHDDDGADFTAANITTGMLPQGGVGVLFNASAVSLADMQTAWGSSINFIPVSRWGNGFANGGDTIAIWSSLADYNLDTVGAGRSTTHAAAVVEYGSSDPWPTANDAASIFLKSLSLNAEAGYSWARSGTPDDTLGSSTANQVVGTLVDHPGGDVGSPGRVGAAAGLLGDYNGDHVINAADYTVWRNNLGGSSLVNDATPGVVDVEDYNYWKAHFGATGAAGGGTAATAVPEPMSFVLLAIGVAAACHCSRLQIGIELGDDTACFFRSAAAS